MHPESFVRVVAKRKGKGAQGTGYFITKDLVLTCRHVVEDADELLVYGPSAKTRQDRNWRAEVAWPGREDLDAALLRVQLDDESQEAPVVPLIDDPLARAAEWESRGCVAKARFSPDSELEGMIALSGKAQRFLVDAASFQIHLDLTADAEDWQGISGAPIFVRERLIGIISEGSTDFERLLKAVPVTALVRDPQFARLTKVTDLKGARERLISDIEEILVDSKNLRERLAGPGYPWAGVGDKAGDLAKAICCQTDTGDVLRALNRAHLEISRSTTETSDTRPLERLCARVLPIFHVQKIGLQYEGSLLRLPVHTATMAELLMAGLAERGYRFRPAGKRTPGEPACRLSTRSSEDGFGLTGLQFIDFVSHQFDRLFIDRTGLFDSDSQLIPSRLRDAAQRLDDELEFLAGPDTDTPIRYYLILQGEDEHKTSPLIRDIRENIPAIKLVRLEDYEASQLRKETQELRLLHELLKRSTEGVVPWDS